MTWTAYEAPTHFIISVHFVCLLHFFLSIATAEWREEAERRVNCESTFPRWSLSTYIIHSVLHALTLSLGVFAYGTHVCQNEQRPKKKGRKIFMAYKMNERARASMDFGIVCSNSIKPWWSSKYDISLFDRRQNAVAPFSTKHVTPSQRPFQNSLSETYLHIDDYRTLFSFRHTKIHPVSVWFKCGGISQFINKQFTNKLFYWTLWAKKPKLFRCQTLTFVPRWECQSMFIYEQWTKCPPSASIHQNQLNKWIECSSMVKHLHVSTFRP